MQNRQIADLPAIMNDASKDRNRLNSKIFDLKCRDVKYLHFHHEFEVGICVSGKGTLYHEGKEYPFQEGDAQIIFPYMRHIHHTLGTEPCHWIWAVIDYELLFEAIGISNFSVLNNLLNRSNHLSGIITATSCPELHKNIYAFMKKHSNEGFSDIIHMAYAFYGILLAASDFSEKTFKNNKFHSAKISSIEPALRRINEDITLGENSSVEELSKLCSMSLSGFRKLFSEIIGASPKVYIQACRTRKAKNLLKKREMSILDIAFSVGYNDISAFNRSFLKTTGTTPSEYRKRHS